MSQRTEQFERLLMRQISDLIPELKDPRVPMIVTVEKVRITPDLASARVLVSALADADELIAMQEALNRASGFLQREIGRELRAKKTPRLSFYIDPREVV